MKFKVSETYTPDDVENDRERFKTEFETDSTDLVEIAELAYSALLDRPGFYQQWEPAYRLEYAKKRLAEDDIKGQIGDILADEVGMDETIGFTFLLFTNNGQSEISIEQVE